MSEDLIPFELPETQPASIKVIGVGGGGGNAVNHMYKQGIKDVDFIVCNTDYQALQKSPVPIKVQLGDTLTKGRGAGNKPSMGREAAIETIPQVEQILQDNTQMVFVTAGMGGGTGTGAAPIIAEQAREMGILTVGIVTIPFRFEGRRRVEQALEGVRELSEHVDSLLVINNEKLRQMYGNLSISEAFTKADDVLTIAAKGIAEIITIHGEVNVDFADVEFVMSNSGVSILGSATASGPDRARVAIEEALHSPLLNNADIRGAKDILLNISSGSEEVTMDEISDITDYIIDEAGEEVNMIWGSVKDNSLTDEVSVTIIATGFEMESIPEFSSGKSKAPETVGLDDNQSQIPANPIRNQNPPVTPKPQTPKPVRPVDEIISIDEETEVEAKNIELPVDERYAPKTPSKPEVEHFTLDGDDVEPSVMKPESTGYYTRQTSIEFDDLDETPIPQKTPADIRLMNNQPTKTQVKQASVASHHQETMSSRIATKDPHVFNYEHVRELDDISQFETTPAYLRKKMQDENFSEENDPTKEVSKFSLGEDEDGNPRLRDTNSFYTDLVD